MPFRSASRALRFVAATVLGAGLLVSLPAELMVVQGKLDGSYDGMIYRYDESTGALRGVTGAMNEGWGGLCRRPDGSALAVANIMGHPKLYAFDPAGNPVVLASLPARADGSAWFSPRGVVYGPDGSLYGEGSLSSSGSTGDDYGLIKLHDASGRAGSLFINAGPGGHQQLHLSTFGPDGNLYAATPAGIARYDGQTGASLGVLVPMGSGGLSEPSAMIFGSDGTLYVGSSASHSVLKFDGASGAFLGTFIAAASGGLNQPTDFAFGPDGRFYVASFGSDAILRYDAVSGALIDAFISGGALKQPRLLVFVQMNDTDWFDDAPPAGAGLGAAGGDSWTWVSGPTYTPSSAPISGSLAHVSALAAGLHEHFFNFAAPLQIDAGDRLFAYIHIDPNNPPREIMLCWASEGSWEHRAYWLQDWINAGLSGSPSRYPVTDSAGFSDLIGRWVRLEVPAAAVGLEGKTVTGMSFSLYDGRATWDRAGKTSATVMVAPPGGNPAPAGLWFANELPTGAWTGAYREYWSWSRADEPYAQAVTHPSLANSGLHEHYFTEASQTMNVAADDTLFAYVKLDPAHPPREVMLSWFDGTWEHRAYWGENLIGHGTPGTVGRYYAGPLPAAGAWTRLEVPAAAVGLAGQAVSGMSFTLYDGIARWSGVGATGGNPPPPAPETVWFDDAFPAGAQDGASGGNPWTWSSAAPQYGAKSLLSSYSTGPHEHYFNFAWEPLILNPGDSFFIYIYLDPSAPPQEVMISFCADNWEHRAYWGANLMSYATNGSPAQFRVGDLPAVGRWVRLEVPAAALDLEGKSVSGLSLTLSNGSAAFDRAGKVGP